jgi:hypothetical protein
MLAGGKEETTEDLDWLTVERGDLEGAWKGLTGDISDSGGKAPDAIGPGEFLLARALSSMAHFICSSSVGARRCSVLGSYRPWSRLHARPPVAGAALRVPWSFAVSSSSISS